MPSTVRSVVCRASAWAGTAGVDECHGPWPFEIAGFHILDAEARRADQLVRLAIEMAAAGNPTPNGRQPVLPTGNAGLRRAAMLGEEKLAAGPEHPSDLRERRCGIVDGAQREGHDGGIDALVLDRQRFAGGTTQLDQRQRLMRPPLCEIEQLGRR